jgi:hypothetical protein
MKQLFMETTWNDLERLSPLQEGELEMELVSPDSSSKRHRLATSRSPYCNILHMVFQ